MKIFRRITGPIMANIGDLLAAAENPENAVKQIIKDIERNIDETKLELVKILPQIKRMESDLDRKADAVDEWTLKAERALEDNNEELARKAIERKLLHEEELCAIQERIDETTAAADTIRENLNTLQGKLLDAKNRYGSLLARKMAAENSCMTSAYAGNSKKSATAERNFQKLHEKILSEEISNVSRKAVSDEDALDGKFRKLAVDAELEKIKARKSGG